LDDNNAVFNLCCRLCTAYEHKAFITASIIDSSLQKNCKGGSKLIVRNAIRCNICGDEIESKHRHDFVTCKCGACSVDGGHDYLRRCFKEKDCYTDISICTQTPKKDE